MSFVGNLDPESRAAIDRLNLDPWVCAVGYVPHAQSVGYLCHADVLLLIVRHIPSRVPGKVYEYMGARKPVLVLGCPHGETLELLTKAGTAIWVDPEDPQAIAGKLVELEALWRSGGLRVEPNEAFIQAHTRKSLAGDLARILDEVSFGGDSGARNDAGQIPVEGSGMKAAITIASPFVDSVFIDPRPSKQALALT